MIWKGPALWSGRETKAGSRLPYAKHLENGTIALRDGAIMQTIHLAGLSFETEDSDSLNHHQAVREVLLRSVLDARFVLYHHIVRHAVPVSGEGDFADPFSRELNDRWNEQLARRQLFANEHFITVVRRPARGKGGLAERLGRKLAASRDVSREDRRTLDAAVVALVAGLQPYGARALGTYGRHGGSCSEMLEFLSCLYNGELRPVAVPAASSDVGNYIPYSRVSFGLNTVETHGPGRHDLSAILSVKDYPTTTRPGLLDGLMRLPHEFLLTETFAPADRQIARERIDLALRRLKSAEEDAVAERMDMLAAKDALSSGNIGFGDHHLTLLVRADTPAGLETAAAEVAAAMADIGAIAVREDTNLEPAYWAQFPGNECYIVRRALISTASAAGFLSLHGFATGNADGNHWGPAAAVFETTSATPYYFNFHQGDLGNLTIIGPSGSGKTVVLNFLAAQAQKFSPRVVFFDKDRGAEIFLRALGGHYTRLLPGEPTGFNPLAIEDTPANRAFLRDWLSVLLATSGPEELAIIANAVESCFEQDLAFRRLRYFRELLAGGRRPQEGDLASRLNPFIRDGEHAWLFDNAEDELDLSQKVVGFDMTALLDNPRLRTPSLMYLFHRVDERLIGEPAMILIDEGWKALDDEVFSARIRDWLKTLRKRNAIVGFATQSARDALESRIAAALVEQTATMIFMPNPKAREEDYCVGFGLTHHELEIIRALPAHSRCFLVRHANHSVVVRLDLDGMADILMVLSGREATVRRLDLIRANVGNDPADWYPLLTNRPWPGGPSQTYRLESAE